ncbi:hypothetical protein TNCV_1222571 [Trichonephila clavipes]|nr:hypothetical protein TNCV_1222571 [Trichonephila clavipes]
MKNSPLEGPPLDRKEFFAFSRSSWYKSLPRSLSSDERCTRVLMAQFQSPLWIRIGGHICFDPWSEPRLRAAIGLGAVLSLVLITFVICRRGSLEVKVTDSWPAYHEFKPSTAEDPPSRGVLCTLNMLILKHPLIDVKVRRGGVILVT